MKTTEIFVVISKLNPTHIIGETLFNDLETAELYAYSQGNVEVASVNDAIVKISENVYNRTFQPNIDEYF